MPVYREIQHAGRKLHAPPSIIGKIAALTIADTLVLCQFMTHSPRGLHNKPDTVKEHFKGRVLAANDMDCIGI